MSMTEAELKNKAKEELSRLAKIMRLNNWTFTISVVSSYELNDAKAWAEMWANYEACDATIKLNEARWLFEIEWDDEEERKLRQSIAHELFHLLFGIKERYKDEKFGEEWMCEMVADAILNALEANNEKT